MRGIKLRRSDRTDSISKTNKDSFCCVKKINHGNRDKNCPYSQLYPYNSIASADREVNQGIFYVWREGMCTNIKYVRFT